MAKFLTTVGNSFYIEQIILNAESNLTLVTPYLNLSKNLIDRLTDADRENINITLIYGKSELSNKEKKKVEALNNIEIYFCENLHAKCYLNEQAMIITSMNLYEFSERNNREMGILIEKELDSQLFIETLKEIESIKNSSILKKTSGRKSLSDLIYLTEDQNEIWNFYFPSLQRVLERNLQEHNVTYNHEDKITIEQCPFEGIDIVISGRIDINFKNSSFFKYLRNNYSDEIEDNSPEMRFYWNYNCINIYPEKNFDVDVNYEGLEKIVEKFSSVIIGTKEIITIAKNLYK